MTEIIEFIAWVVKKTFWSFAVFIAFILLAIKKISTFLMWRVADLIGILFHIIACCTVVRLPLMIRFYMDDHSNHNLFVIRFFGLYQTMILLMDIPVAAMAVFVFASMIRFRMMVDELRRPDVVEKMRDDWKKIYWTGLRPRKIVLKHFLHVFLDVFRFVWHTGVEVKVFIVSILRVVGRKVRNVLHVVLTTLREVIRTVYTVTDQSLRRLLFWFTQVLRFFLNLAMDNIAVFFNVVAFCTIIRAPAVIAFYTRDPDVRGKWRRFGFIQTVIFLMDMPIIFMGMFVGVTFIRVPLLLQEVQQPDFLQKIVRSWKEEYFTGGELRYLIIKHFFNVFVDVLFYSLAAVCLISWRSRIFCRRYADPSTKYLSLEDAKREVIFTEILELIWDIPLILCMIVTCASWRLPFIYREIKARMEAGEGWDCFIRYVGVQNIPRLVADVPCVLAFVITMSSWRAPIMYSYVRGRNILHLDKEEQAKLRANCLVEFCNMLVDVPCVIAFVVTMLSWRASIMWRLFRDRDLFNIRHQIELRAASIQHFFGLIFDIPFLIALGIVLLSWRSPIMVLRLRRWLSSDDLYNSFFGFYAKYTCIEELFSLIVDIPFIILSVPIILTVWRVPNLVRGIKCELGKGCSLDFWHHRQSGIRKLVVQEFLHLFVDAISFSLGMVVMVTLWRAYPLVQDIKKKYREYQTNKDNLEARERHMRESNSPEVYPNNTEISIQKGWDRCMWSIYGSCVFHFFALLIDLTAFPFLIVLLVTGLRTSKVISALLGGQFYMMFCVTVYIEFLRLLRDVFYLCVFILLFTLRPVASWIHVLEDDDHKEYRLLGEVMLWIPDICSERHSIYDELDDTLALYLKQNTDKGTARSKLRTMFDTHLERIHSLSSRLSVLEMADSELACLLNRVEFYERKRVNKMMRKYYIQWSYINNCNPELHAWNLISYRDEMEKYDGDVDAAYTALSQYKPDKVPLYKTKSGLKTRSEEETRAVILACLPRGDFFVAGMALLSMLFVYRAPAMLKRLHKRSYNRYNIVVSTLREYLWDFIMLLDMLFVLMLLYRAPMLMADVLDCLIQKKSWSAARNVARRYPPKIFADFSHLLSLLLSWKNPRYVFTMTLFGALMPAELFLGVIKIGVSNKPASYILTLVLYGIFVVFPYMIIQYGAIRILAYDFEMGWLIGAVVCVLLLLLLVQLLVMIGSMALDSNKTFLLAMPRCAYVRFNWHNIHAILFEILNYLQLLALVFKIADIPMYGAPTLRWLASKVYLSSLHQEVVFWMTLVFFLLWFFLCGCPQIFEFILKTYPVGTFASHSSWRLALSFLSNSLFVTMISNMTSFIACHYRPCPAADVTAALAASSKNLGIMPACNGYFLVEHPSVPCWNRSHIDSAKVALLAMIWYITTSIIFGAQYGDPESKKLDIGFSPLYSMVLNIFKAAMLIVVILIVDTPYVVLGCLLAGFILCCNFTLNFEWLFNCGPSNSKAAIVFRVFTFVSCIFATIAVIVAFLLNDPNSMVPMMIFLIGTGVSSIVSVIRASESVEHSPVVRDREVFKEEVLVLEMQLSDDNRMHRTWTKEKQTWHRLVYSVREAAGEEQAGDASNSDSTRNPGGEEVGVCLLPQRVTVDSSSQGNSGLRTGTWRNLGRPVRPTTNNNTTPEGVLELQKNGQNLLLILEQYILYDSYNYTSLTQRKEWIQKVRSSSWPGLLSQLRILITNLDGTFNEPCEEAIQRNNPSGDYTLEGDPFDDIPPPPEFVRKTEEDIARESAEIRTRVLDFLGAMTPHGQEYMKLFDKLLPTGPVFKSEDMTRVGTFEIRFHSSSVGVITEYEPPGFQMAVGARIAIGKKLCGSVSKGVGFTDGRCPVGEKGPIGVSVRFVTVVKQGEVLKLDVNGRQVDFDKALASCKTIEWE